MNKRDPIIPLPPPKQANEMEFYNRESSMVWK